MSDRPRSDPVLHSASPNASKAAPNAGPGAPEAIPLDPLPDHPDQALTALRRALDACMAADRVPFQRRISGLKRRLQRGEPVDRGVPRLRDAMQRSAALRARRQASVPPELAYPEELPLVARREELLEAIAGNQVIIVCGETGSGKTTQLPKLCLELGRGVDGTIGHTQPRRLAARTVAARIADELNVELGEQVGYRVRFGDHASERSLIKLMTDGILLAETQQDPTFSRYDTLIIDEAHERSLNIDFLLGYLKRLLPKRPDLKLIITSATIDPESFARHFDDAPIVTVSGRTYPVEVRYRPLVSGSEDGDDRDQGAAIIEALDELGREGPGDILVFLATEREIRDTADLIRRHRPGVAEVLPLYARLSTAEQNRVFKGHRGRRIVLATNVAETSLTVPGIRYVIDTGRARISRYSVRAKVQRLPIERISQASAGQRAGRCGRLGPGIAIRLYDESDFERRPAYTDPEVLRTNLASVILTMAALGLGEPADFPFLDPPDTRLIVDGYRLLFELGAVDEANAITDMGRKLSRLPIDPRLARMLLEARVEGCVPEVLVIVSLLELADPRERPADRQQAADEAHARFQDSRSDFVSILKLWAYLEQMAAEQTKGRQRELCAREFLSYIRVREWRDIQEQLADVLKELDLWQDHEPDPQREFDYAGVHRALLAGLLGNIGRRDNQDYLSARNRRFTIFPGSGLAKRGPKWVMAAELVETQRLYARTVAQISVEWVEPLARHLVHRHYFEPHWEPKAGQVAAYEKVSLYGLEIVAKRKVNYGPIQPADARAIFIQRALVEGDFRTRGRFFAHNRALIESIQAMESKARRRDILVDEHVIFGFYDARLPAGIHSAPQFEQWRKEVERDEPEYLFMTQEGLMRAEADGVALTRFPDHLQVRGLKLPLQYCFEPKSEADGVTVRIPLIALNQLDGTPFTYLVPGLLEEKITQLIKSLPKPKRRAFVPAPDFARACAEALGLANGQSQDLALEGAVAEHLQRITGQSVAAEDFQPEALERHLRMRFEVVDGEGKVLASGRDFAALKASLAERAERSFQERRGQDFECDEVTDWSFGALPREVPFESAGVTLTGYPALVAEGDRVALRLMDAPDKADAATRHGLKRLFARRLGEPLRYISRNLPGIQSLCLRFSSIGSCRALSDDIVEAALERAVMAAPLPRDEAAFRERLEAGRGRLVSEANGICAVVDEVLSEYTQIRKRIKGNLPLSWVEAVRDVNEQLESLVFPGFVCATPSAWFPELPRFLRAIGKRLEKLDREPDRDRLRRSENLDLWERYRKARDCGRLKPGDPAHDDLRWLLEEWRVHVFAQELGTARPVSRKRLERALSELGL